MLGDGLTDAEDKGSYGVFGILEALNWSVLLLWWLIIKFESQGVKDGIQNSVQLWDQGSPCSVQVVLPPFLPVSFAGFLFHTISTPKE